MVCLYRKQHLIKLYIPIACKPKRTMDRDYMNILVLDDNSHRITFFQNALKKHKVTVCRHARTAIRALKDRPFDIIFLDHDLRGEPADPDDENCGSEVARF